MAADFPDETSLRITRELAATPARVWEAFTVAEQMAGWMWATYTSNTVAECDARVGGRYRVYTDAPEGDFGWASDRWGFAGIYVVLEPHERIVYTIHWDGPVGYNQTGEMTTDEAVIVELTADADDTTRLVMWHIGIPADGVSAQTHAEGIESMFDSLDALLAG